MQTTERPPSGPARGSSPMRGVVLVAVAVVLGFFVLRAIDDTGGGPIARRDRGRQRHDRARRDDGGVHRHHRRRRTARPPGEVVVLVANASGVQGAAGAQAEAIAAGGYQVLRARQRRRPRSRRPRSWRPPGFEADAAALAAAIGAPPSRWRRCPTRRRST